MSPICRGVAALASASSTELTLAMGADLATAGRVSGRMCRAPGRAWGWRGDRGVGLAILGRRDENRP